MKTFKMTALALVALNALAATAASASVIRCESRLEGSTYLTFGHAGATADHPMALEISHPVQGAITLQTEGNIALAGRATVLPDGGYFYEFGMLSERDHEETVRIAYENGYSPSRAMYYLNVWSDSGKLVDTREGLELQLDPAHPEGATAVLIRSDRLRSPIDGAALFAHWGAPTRTELPVSCAIGR